MWIVQRFVFVLAGCAIAAANKAPTGDSGIWKNRRVAQGGKANTNSSQVIQQYVLLPPKQIRDMVYRLATNYSDFVKLTTSQERYSLPTAGNSSDCPYDNITGCLVYILHIQDFVAHPEGSMSSKALPEVFWSGCLHGNERVGPTAVLEAAELLLRATQCEAYPRLVKKGTPAWSKELAYARSCRKKLQQFGIDDGQRRWLARLVTTRRLLIVPTANALGYFQNIREENGIDPNRDFPYDEAPSLCMQSIAARTMNEIWRERLFQLSLTFHAGTEVVGYEWGAFPYLGYASPDDTAQLEISAAYSKYAGGFSDVPPYVYGDMNDLVYAVNGGMEDWAYAASWDTSYDVTCQPTTYGGYPKSKTKYSGGTLRAFNILIETSNHKNPAKNSLGTSEYVLTSTSEGNGHVTRNIRLSILSLDMVQPYASISVVNELMLAEDLVPQAVSPGESCQSAKLVQVPGNGQKVVVRWSVGGAVTVDQTNLWYAKWDDIPASMLNCTSQPDPKALKKLMKVATPLGAVNGSGIFAANGASPPFAASFATSSFKPKDRLVVLAVAQVDKNWTRQPADVKPTVPPQAHVVNVRTNLSWHYETKESMIQGRLFWFSFPLTIEIGPKMNQTAVTVEVSNRIPQ